MAVGSLSTRVGRQLKSLQGLHHRLRDIGNYLQKVQAGDLPVNNQILGLLQDVFNLLPNLSTPSNTDDTSSTENNDLMRSLSIKTNDQLMAVYISSLIRAITAFHDLINNKIENKQAHEEEKEKERKKEEEKQKEKKEKEEGDKLPNGESAEKEAKDSGSKPEGFQGGKGKSIE